MKRTAFVLCLCLTLSNTAFSETSKANPLVKMSIQQLMDMEITSVSKAPQPLSQAAAAIFVINQEDIRRSTATSIPELLRMVPGVDVARTSSSAWAISARGFNSSIANKLLVLIDGRTVYTPLFAGVYWDVQDMPLEDIDRIEVIRGPGATLWGANAVNGVINIITKRARDTQGGQATFLAGNVDKALGSVRWGGELEKDVYYRVYGKGFERAASENGNDAWDQGRAGFRVDNEKSAENQYTFQGDIYSGENDVRYTANAFTAPFTRLILEDEGVNGGNLLWRWNHIEDAARDSQLQVYYDETGRGRANFIENRYAFDVDWKKRFPVAENHDLTWGAGYRLMADDTTGFVTTSFIPSNEVDQLFSAFVQDKITLAPEKIWLTLGSKFEHNDYSGYEIEPSARIAWLIQPKHTVWAAVSRAARTPTRLDHHLSVSGWSVPGTTLATALGDSSVGSEYVTAYEAGYRFQPTDRFSVDTTAFINRYDDLSTWTLTASTPALITYTRDDNMEGETYGAEVASNYQITPEWKLAAAYALFKADLESTNDVLNQQAAAEGSSPKNQASLRSFIDLPHGFEFDSQLRYVDSLFALNTSSYVELDLRLAWHVRPNVEVSIAGQNLLEDNHLEFASDTSTTAPQVGRSVYGKITVTF